MSAPLIGLRSLLFTPASRPDRVDKAIAAGADAVILDLEDGVGPEEKPEARCALIRFLADREMTSPWLLRLNHIRTAAGIDDLVMLRSNTLSPAAFMLPKVEGPEEMDIVASHLPASATIVALIETARGLQAASEIANHPRVAALALGGADLAVDLSADLDWTPLLYARGSLVCASASAGLPCWDVPSLAVDDPTALGRETEQVRAMGFCAKMAIHPQQITVINQVFAPASNQVARAERIIETFDAAGGQPCMLDGQMIDLPVAHAARRLLERARSVRREDRGE